MQEDINIQLIETRGVYDFFSDPEYRRQTVALQLVDIIIGHTDRHMDNVKVICDDAGNVIRVLGVDNDATFSLEICDHGDIELAKCLRWTMVGYPRVVDGIMLNAINNLDEQVFRDQLSKRLTANAIEMTLNRWNALKTYLNSKVVTVIQSGEWGSSEALELLKQRQLDANNSSVLIPTSYVGKFMEECKTLSKIPTSQIKT